MKKDRNTKRRLQLNKLTKQERAMKEAKHDLFAHPVDSLRILTSSEGAATKSSLNKRLIAIILAIVMVVGLLPMGMVFLRPKAGETIDAVEMTVRVNNDNYGTVSIAAGQIADNIADVTDTLSLPEGCTFERAIMEDTNYIPSTKTTIAAVGTYEGEKYYSKDVDTNTGTRLENGQLLVLVYSNTYTVTTNATHGSIDCDDSLRHGNALHVTLTPDLDHSVSPEDVTYTINGTDSHPTAINNNSFTISAAEINGDIEITVDFPAISEYTIQDAHNIKNADSKYYNLYGEDGHGGITQGRGQSAVGNPSDNFKYVFNDYTYSLITPLASTEMRNNPKYLNWTISSLDFSTTPYSNLYESLGYTNIKTNSNDVITDVQPNNVVAGQPAEFLLYSQSWSGNTAWILDSLTINGEYINFPSETEITDPNNKPSESTTLKKGNMAGTEVTVTLDEIGTGLYWKSLNDEGEYDPDVTYKHSSSNKASFTNGNKTSTLETWQLDSYKKKRTYYRITLSTVHDDVEVAYNFKDSSERTIVITDLEGIESAFAAQEHRRGLTASPYERFYSVPVDSNNNLALDAHNEYPAYYQERHSNLFRIPSNNLYLYQVKSGYNPYTVDATARYFQDDGTVEEVLSTDTTKHLMLGGGGNLPGVVIKNASQEGLEVIDEEWPSDLQEFVSVLYDYNSNLRYWGNSNSDGTTYGLARTTTSNQTDAETLETNIPLLLESIKDYENIVKDTKSNYRFYAIALLENEAMTQELKLTAHPYEYQVLFDLNGGSYNTLPSGLIATSTTGVYTRGDENGATRYTLENGATSTRMPKGEPNKNNSIFLGWQLYKDGSPVNTKKYTSNEVFAIDEDSVWYAEGDVTKDKGHTFIFKAVWEDKETSENYANVNILAKHQTVPNGTDQDYTVHYNETEAQVIGNTVLLNLHDDFDKSEYYTLNPTKSQLATKIEKGKDNELYAVYDLTLCDVTVTKKVIGSPKTAKEFPITIVLTYDEESPINFNTAKNTITVDGTTATGTVDPDAGTITFSNVKFRRSQTIKLSDVPYGWGITVSEPISEEKPNGNEGELDYTTTITSLPATAGSQAEAQSGDTTTVWEGVVKENTDIVVTNRSESFLDLTKTLEYGENGTYDLRLTAYANGSIAKEAEIITEQVPTDYVLVVDQSTSMNTKDMPTTYVNPVEGNWYISQDETEPTARYIKVPDENGDNYYRVYRKRGYMYEYHPGNTIYSGDIAGDSLGWFMAESTVEQGVASEYFYNPYLDGETDDTKQDRFYPVRISIKGEELFYAVKLQYDEDNDGIKTNKTLNPPAEPNYKNYTSITGWNDYNPNSFGYGTVNDLVQDWANLFASFGSGTYLTYGEALGQKAGMYVAQELYTRHVGFNQLCYKDKYGVEHTLIKATFCDANGTPLGGSCDANASGLPSEGKTSTTGAFWNGELYTDDENARETRLVALQRSLEQFVNDIANQKDDNNAPLDHRIAIVGFSGNSTTHKNSEILSGVDVTDRTVNASGFYSLDEPDHNIGHDGPQYYGKQSANNTVTDADYQSALVRTNNQADVDELVAATKYITAYGSTQPELGFEIAENILEKRTEKTYINSRNVEKERNTVIIFFTDGRPGAGDTADQYAAANKVVEATNSIKTSTEITSNGTAGLTQIYSVGLFGEADGNPLTYTETIVGNQVEYTTGYNYSAVNSNNLSDASNEAFAYSLAHAEQYRPIEYTYINGYVKWGVRDDATAKAYWINHRDYRTSSTGIINRTYRYTIKSYNQFDYYYRKSLQGEYGYPAQQNDTIGDYMSVVSSEYPEAEDFDPVVGTTETYEEASDRVRGTSVKQNSLNRFYYNATSGADLDWIFEEIAETIPGSNVNITLDATNAVLRDVINGDDFVVPDNDHKPTINAWTEVCTVSKNSNNEEVIPEPDSDAWQKVADIDDQYISYDNGTIDVQGFDYATNFVGYDNENHQGQRIVVEVKGLVPQKDALGELESNKDTSGVYKLTDEADVLLDAFDIPNLYRYAYRLKETGQKVSDEFTVSITSDESTPSGILVPYNENGRSTSPLTFADNNPAIWDDVVSDDVIYFETKSDAAVKLIGNVTSSTKEEDKYIYDVSWENTPVDPPFGTDFVMYKNNQALEDSTILVHNAMKYRDVTINLAAEDSSYVAAGHEFEVTVDLTGSKLGDKRDTLNGINPTNVQFDGDGNKLTATIKLVMDNDGEIPSVTFKIPDGAELEVDHSDYFYTTDPITYTDESFAEGAEPIDYAPHEITQNTVIYINDIVKDIIETGVMDENGSSHAVLYVLIGMIVLSGGAGVAYVYRKKDEFSDVE